MLNMLNFDFNKIEINNISFNLVIKFIILSIKTLIYKVDAKY